MNRNHDPAPPFAAKIFRSAFQLGLVQVRSLQAAMVEAERGRTRIATLHALLTGTGTASPTVDDLMVLVGHLGDEAFARAAAHAAGLEVASRPSDVEQATPQTLALRLGRVVMQLGADLDEALCHTSDGGAELSTIERQDLNGLVEQVRVLVSRVEQVVGAPAKRGKVHQLKAGGR